MLYALVVQKNYFEVYEEPEVILSSSFDNAERNLSVKWNELLTEEMRENKDALSEDDCYNNVDFAQIKWKDGDSVEFHIVKVQDNLSEMNETPAGEGMTNEQITKQITEREITHHGIYHDVGAVLSKVSIEDLVRFFIEEVMNDSNHLLRTFIEEKIIAREIENERNRCV